MSRVSQNIIRELLIKKRHLAEQLLSQSKHFVLAQNPLFQEQILASKTKIIKELQRNDNSIATWEQSTGKIAKNVEKELHTDILRLFQLTSENDAYSQLLLEQEYRELLAERKKFGEGTRISKYLQRHSRSNTSSPDLKTKGIGFKLQRAYHENR